MFTSIRSRFTIIYFLLVFIAMIIAGIFIIQSFEDYNLNIASERLDDIAQIMISELSKIEDNDLYDLFGFTMGVSYCDIFFGEKRFVDLAKKSKLDKIYGTIITSSLEEFKKAISELT